MLKSSIILSCVIIFSPACKKNNVTSAQNKRATISLPEVNLANYFKSYVNEYKIFSDLKKPKSYAIEAVHILSADDIISFDKESFKIDVSKCEIISSSMNGNMMEYIIYCKSLRLYFEIDLDKTNKNIVFIASSMQSNMFRKLQAVRFYWDNANIYNFEYFNNFKKLHCRGKIIKGN